MIPKIRTYKEILKEGIDDRRGGCRVVGAKAPGILWIPPPETESR